LAGGWHGRASPFSLFPTPLIATVAGRSVAPEQMRARHPGSAATTAAQTQPEQRLTPAPQPPAARILALQRRAGNAAVVRLLARAPKQWENPEVLKVVYPAREAQLRKYVAMFRELEQIDAKDPSAPKKTPKELQEAANALSGADLANEVERLLKSSVTPEWMRDIVRPGRSRQADRRVEGEGIEGQGAAALQEA
jgi:hypothetical protein